MPYTSHPRRRRTDERRFSAPPEIVLVRVPINKTCKIAHLRKIEMFSSDRKTGCLHRTIIPIGHHVTKKHNRHSLRDHRKVIAHPVRDFIHRVGRFMIAERHGRHDKMDAASLERAPCRTEKLFETRFTGRTGNHIVVPQTVDYRTPHRMRIHCQKMRPHSTITADVSGMDYERSVILIRDALYILHPLRRIHPSDFRVRKMDKRTTLTCGRFPGTEPKNVRLRGR